MASIITRTYQASSLVQDLMGCLHRLLHMVSLSQSRYRHGFANSHTHRHRDTDTFDAPSDSNKSLRQRSAGLVLGKRNITLEASRARQVTSWDELTGLHA